MLGLAGFGLKVGNDGNWRRIGAQGPREIVFLRPLYAY